MIEATSPLSYLGEASSLSGNRTESDRDAFLRLLITQLQNQDPLSPLEAHEFASQLASFASVEQLTQLNNEMILQTDSVLLAAQMSKTAFSAALIGRQVVAEGDQVTIPSSGSAAIRVEIGGNGGDARLRLLDASGSEVAVRDLGSLAAGRQWVTLPSDLPAGTYTYELTVTGSDGEVVPVVTYTSGTVDGVSFENGQILLRIGSSEIALDFVAEIGVVQPNSTVVDPFEPEPPVDHVGSSRKGIRTSRI